MSAAEELAKKKARLAELRKAKEERLLADSTTPTPSVEQLLAAAGSADHDEQRQNLFVGRDVVPSFQQCLLNTMACKAWILTYMNDHQEFRKRLLKRLVLPHNHRQLYQHLCKNQNKPR